MTLDQANATITCPVCRVPLMPPSTRCPDCGEDLAVLVHLRSRAAIAYNEGLRLAREGSDAAAIRAMERTLAEDPANTAAARTLAKLHARQGELDRARDLWQGILRDRPEDVGARAGLAWLSERERAEGEASRQSDQQCERQRLAERSRARRRLVLSAAATFLAGAAIVAAISAAFFRGGDETRPVADVVRAEPTRGLTATPSAAAATVSATPLATASPAATTAPVNVSAVSATPSATPTPVPNLTAAVEAALRGQEVLRDVSIEVVQEGAIIRLRGEVLNLPARYAAEQAAAGVPGVTAVDLRPLTVAPTQVVQPGDSLWIIASRVYGTSDQWRRLADANGLAPPYTLRAGQVLIVPQ